MQQCKEEYLAEIAKAFRETRQDVEASEMAMKLYTQSRFHRIEEMLNGPYDKLLEWDWVPSESVLTSVVEALAVNRLCLREVPEFQVSVKEYFARYARSPEDVEARFREMGFYTPPKTAIFQQFYAEVIEGRKLLLHITRLKRAKVPADQFDLALFKAQKFFSPQSELQQYLPSCPPETSSDKCYYLDIANSLVGLHFKVIFPLSESEKELATSVRTSVVSACDGLADIYAAAQGLGALRPVLQNVISPNTFTVSGFLDLYARYHSCVHGTSDDSELALDNYS